MGTWTNAKLDKLIHNINGAYREITYKISGVSGDTGGTLTTRFKRIINCFVTAYTASAVCTSLTWRISNSTVVVAYSNPGATHTVLITVTGK